ncbi:MAG: CheB methylesterase domain-containing protein [Campylobacterota bacterium]|nr:CheB methylesterase domain-containing protein [Campylobacterota bacterium]
MKKKILLVGASTGGPSQIKEMLAQISSLSCTVIIVQHMREEVLPFFIKDLQESLHVKVQTTPLCTNFNEPSIIVCAQSSVIRKNSRNYEIISDTKEQKYTPDINKFFNSFALLSADFDLHVLIMTGIGSDGVQGAQNLKMEGAKIIAQDEKSCPVYGMPRVAVESGIVDEIKTLDEIKACFRSL